MIESLHNASLIIDDIEDGSTVRRDQQCVHLKMGLKQSIVSANFVYFKVFHKLISLVPHQKQLEFSKVFTEEMLLSHLGQADDLFCHVLVKEARPELDSFAESDYIRMVVSKTGSILRMMVKMICCAFDSSIKLQDQLISIVEKMGISFQIYDDYLNIKGNLHKGSIPDDLVEKKLTLMVIKTLESSQRVPFLSLFLRRDLGKEDIDKLMKYLEESGSLKYALSKRDEYGRECRSMAESLPASFNKELLLVVLQKIIFR